VVVYHHGERIPCELTYLGMEGNEHMWSCPTRFIPEEGDRVSIEMMPPQTGIHFGVIEHE